MKNYVQKGDTITVTVVSGSDAVDVSAGDGYSIGSLFGVAQHDAAVGETVELAMNGVFDLAKTTSQAWYVGDKVYWDQATGKATTTAGSLKLIGIAIEDEGSNDTTGRVRVTGASAN